MALEQHMSETARLIIEGAKGIGVADGLRLTAWVSLPIAEQADGTPYSITASWAGPTPGRSGECTVRRGTDTPVSAFAAEMLDGVRSCIEAGDGPAILAVLPAAAPRDDGPALARGDEPINPAALPALTEDSKPTTEPAREARKGKKAP